MSAGAPSRVLTSLGRQALRHRRLLAAGLFAGAVACALAVLAPPSAPTAAVIVAAKPLDGGVRLSSARPPDGAPPGRWQPRRLTSEDTAIGRVLAGAGRSW